MSLGQQCPPHTGVHVYVPTHLQSFNAQRAATEWKKRPLMNQHQLLNNTALCRSVWESFFKDQSLMQMKKIYKNKDREPVFSRTMKRLKNTHSLGKWRPVCFSSPPTAVWKTKPKTWGILSKEERGGGSPVDWQLIVAAHAHAHTISVHTCRTASLSPVSDLQDSRWWGSSHHLPLPSPPLSSLKGHYRSHSVCTPLGKACTVSFTLRATAKGRWRRKGGGGQKLRMTDRAHVIIFIIFTQKIISEYCFQKFWKTKFLSSFSFLTWTNLHVRLHVVEEEVNGGPSKWWEPALSIRQPRQPIVIWFNTG